MNANRLDGIKFVLSVEDAVDNDTGWELMLKNCVLRRGVMGRRKGLSSMQRTLKALRDQGVICDIAEKFNPYAGPFGIRQDMFGFVDLIALYPGGRGIVAVQACFSDVKKHIRKITDECTEEAIAWLECKGEIEVWGWRKLLVQRGGKLRKWTPRIITVTLADFR